jgi:hypothetical protein
MSDESQEPMEEPVMKREPAKAEPDAGAPTGDAWDDVLARVGDLGDAISQWARAATEDPENRRKLDEIRAGMDDMARQAQETFEDIDATEFGKQFREGVEVTGRAVGDAAQKVSDAAAPHVALIFAGLADAFGRAAAGVDASMKGNGEQAAREPEAGEPATDASEEGSEE